MQIVDYTKAQNNLRALIDEVCEDDTEIIITTKDAKSVMMVSLETYGSSPKKVQKDVKAALNEFSEGQGLDENETYEAILKKYED